MTNWNSLIGKKVLVENHTIPFNNIIQVTVLKATKYKVKLKTSHTCKWHNISDIVLITPI